MKKWIIAAFTAFSTMNGMAQNVEDFKQPYPAGQKLTPTPNFTGEVWLEPVGEAAYREAVSQSLKPVVSLDERQQAIAAIGSYTGHGDLEHLPQALVQGLEAGMTVNEIKEVLVQAYAYCGFPRSLRAIQTFMSVIF